MQSRTGHHGQGTAGDGERGRGVDATVPILDPLSLLGVNPAMATKNEQRIRIHRASQKNGVRG